MRHVSAAVKHKALAAPTVKARTRREAAAQLQRRRHPTGRFEQHEHTHVLPRAGRRHGRPEQAHRQRHKQQQLTQQQQRLPQVRPQAVDQAVDHLDDKQQQQRSQVVPGEGLFVCQVC